MVKKWPGKDGDIDSGFGLRNNVLLPSLFLCKPATESGKGEQHPMRSFVVPWSVERSVPVAQLPVFGDQTILWIRAESFIVRTVLDIVNVIQKYDTRSIDFV